MVKLRGRSTELLVGFTVLERQRKHPHADEIGTMDALKGGGDDRLDTEEYVPFAAQSREEPVPYWLPANTTFGASIWAAS